jgi:acetolactate synthase-1/2/3 large subunit
LSSRKLDLSRKELNMESEGEKPPREGRDRKITAKVETTAQAYLELLSLRGIEYFFGNAGTDFASIVDAFASRIEHGKEFPRPVTVPHEIPLISMAHGYYLATGRPQVVMVHVGIGTANGLGALIHAHRARIPILVSAGRTPITEEGSPASRNVFIHWGQECFDQAGMVREYVKWDYELRTPSQLEAVVDRALTMAMTEPRGPVYLMLPREVLASRLEVAEFQAQPRYDLPTFSPDPNKVQEVADLLIKAEFPLIITASAGRSPAAVQALMDLAEDMGIGVISFNPEYMNLPTGHPCHLGFVPDASLSKADVILVVDCDVPWYPSRVQPRSSAVVVQVGIDPLYSRYPIRGYPSDITLQGEPARVLSEIGKATAHHQDTDDHLATRRRTVRQMHDDMLKGRQERVRKAAHDKPIDFQWMSHNVSQILTDDTVVVNERDNSMHPFTNQLPGSYFSTPHAGYLGWGLGAALGIKLARPDGTVIATVGDGCYLFSVPSACHFVSRAYELPILVIVYNNGCYQAVKGATRALHPDGWAVRTGQFPLSELQPTADFEKICEAFGGYGERVESPDQIQPALKRALEAVRRERRQALLNVICKHPS